MCNFDIENVGSCRNCTQTISQLLPLLFRVLSNLKFPAIDQEICCEISTNSLRLQRPSRPDELNCSLPPNSNISLMRIFENSVIVCFFIFCFSKKRERLYHNFRKMDLKHPKGLSPVSRCCFVSMQYGIEVTGCAQFCLIATILNLASQEILQVFSPI